MNDIILLIEPTDCPYSTPEKAANLFMNRFAIDEDAWFEIPAILELANETWKVDFPDREDATNNKGFCLIII